MQVSDATKEGERDFDAARRLSCANEIPMATTIVKAKMVVDRVADRFMTLIRTLDLDLPVT